MNNRNKYFAVALVIASFCSNSLRLNAAEVVKKATEPTFTSEPFSATASLLKKTIREKPQVAAAVTLLVFMLHAMHTLNTQPSLNDELCDWNNFNDDVKDALKALIKGRFSEFCKRVHKLWRVYFVGRTKKLVDTEHEVLQEDGSILITKDKAFVRSNFGFCGWLFSFGGSMKDIGEKVEPVQKTLALVGMASLLGLK